MRVLLDTHTALWFAADDPRLSPVARASVEDPANDAFLSLASVWEIAIKVSLGKLTLDGSVMDFVTDMVGRNGVELLGIELPHVTKVADLTLHHRDPFDRLLFAQCLVMEMPIISRDPAANLYGVKRIW